jgi:hypothetical protein
MFHQRERLYKSKVGTSERYYEIVPKTVTLQKDPSSIYNPIQPRNMTVFKEIDIVPYEEMCGKTALDFGLEVIPSEQVSRKEFAELAFDVFKAAIYTKWDPNKFHVIMHSSGYDSRLVSLAIKSLYEEYGSDWFGNTVFLNSYWESEQFKRIMEYEGWDNYIIFNENAKKDEVFKGSFDFSQAWKQLNGGMIGWPLNGNWESIRWLQERELIPKENIQCIGGAGSNEISRTLHEGKKIGWYFDWIYYHTLSTFPLKGRDWIFPFLNFDFISVIIKYGLEYNNKSGFSKNIIDQIEPDLNKIERIDLKELIEQGYTRISDNIIRKAIDDYKNSWYGKYVRPKEPAIKPSGKFEYSTWWGMWNLASFCEYLLQNDFKIRIV